MPARDAGRVLDRLFDVPADRVTFLAGALAAGREEARVTGREDVVRDGDRRALEGDEVGRAVRVVAFGFDAAFGALLVAVRPDAGRAEALAATFRVGVRDAAGFEAGRVVVRA